jgi:hypothetical protein
MKLSFSMIKKSETLRMRLMLKKSEEEAKRDFLIFNLSRYSNQLIVQFSTLLFFRVQDKSLSNIMTIISYSFKKFSELNS